ncbi:hypothetical protein SAMD00023353_2500400 [Rosellinia necatrix]|uniref:Uncharacterized protein n=1 Tax=Rosellinia necatrix TaxID=77044 RepID=A0A1W2TG83_ROSNE|nr:hypothetical protein SAMD00023353_2500400 [Rosellinia necatrix]
MTTTTTLVHLQMDVNTIASPDSVLKHHPRSRQYGFSKHRHIWEIGDIAFLKRASEFKEHERVEFLQTDRIHTNATGHPVIILDRSKDCQYYIVETVSAYSSDEYNNYQPPWQQKAHSRKDVNGFRAFEGSVRPNENHDYLRLADNAVWPKTNTSWVYMYHPYLVPASVLINYNKTADQLRMAPDSLQDLLQHLDAKCRAFRKQKIEISEMCAIPIQSPAKSIQENWRRTDKENHRVPSVTTTRPPLAPGTNLVPAKPKSPSSKLLWSSEHRPSQLNGQGRHYNVPRLDIWPNGNRFGLLV